MIIGGVVVGTNVKTRSLALFSKKGGVGRTHLAAGVSRALAKGQKVLLFDLDAVIRSCDFALGLENDALFSFDDLLSGVSCERVLLSPPDLPGLFLCPAPSAESVFSDPGASGAIFDTARQIGADFVIFDPPARGAGYEFALKHADEPLLVSDLCAPSVLGAEITSEEIFAAGKTPRLILNRFSPDEKPECPPAEIIDRTHARLLGVIPDRKTAGAALGSLCFDNIAARLRGNELPLFSGATDAKKLRKLLLSQE